MLVDVPARELPGYRNAFNLCRLLNQGGLMAGHGHYFGGFGGQLPVVAFVQEGERSAAEERFMEMDVHPNLYQLKPFRAGVL